MKRFRRALSAILAAVMVYSVLWSSLFGAFAAVTPVSLTVDKFENGTLTFHWTKPSGTAAAVVSYHKPDPDSTTDAAILVVSAPVVTGSSISISGLEADTVYDIGVTLYGSVNGSGNPSGNPTGRGLMFYLPSMSFHSAAGGQTYASIAGGGREIGSTPKLDLSWKMPKVFYDPNHTLYPGTDSNTDNNVFIDANSANALNYMQTMLRSVYNDTRELKYLDFRINISSQLNLLNSGDTQAALLIGQDSSGSDSYTAAVSGIPEKIATVTTPDALGFVGFELWGRTDESAAVPTPSGINVLPDDDILPGTVYYMNIKPVYRNSAKAAVNAITVGNPGDQNGSILSGDRSYTSTPIRFQVTKDSANNIYVKIFKINKGSLDLPRLYYEVQATDDPSIQGDWSIKKTMDDSYFSGASAVTVITGVNPNNEVYYKIVVKSDSPDDKLESLPLPYTLTVDNSRPPLPTGIAVEGRALTTGQVTPPTGTAITIKSTDVTISWDKPLNWSSTKSNLYFHFLLNTNQSDMSTDVPMYVNSTYWGSYPAQYRLVKYVSASSPNIKEVGNRLSYTIKGFDLFKWEDSTGNAAGTITNNLNYPAFLAPNTVYYLQMYTTTAANRGSTLAANMSDKSTVASFTTLNGVELDVPLPMGFTTDANSKETSGTEELNYIDLKLDKVTNLDWKNYVSVYDTENYTYRTYYDIYMNTRTDTTFSAIATTEDLNGDVGFTGADDLQSTSIKAHVSKFTTSSSISLFGDKLLPNTTYYFKARTRLVQRTTAGALVMQKESVDTAVLPVTTIRLTVTPPDDSSRKPLAPTDFGIAVDSSQAQLLSGNSVTFTWKRQEDDVVYQLIRTTMKTDPAATVSDYGTDPEYVSFLTDYHNYTDNSGVKKLYLDPTLPSSTYAGKFTYDSSTRICTYTVDKRMFPNKLYYFSLKAVRVDSTRKPLGSSAESVWVSIPVTTSLIDAPTSLEVVSAAELGFFWTDSTPGLTAEDFTIYTKLSSASQYTRMNKSQATIVKDKDGCTYYGRVTGLAVGSSYDVKVTKGTNTPVYEKGGLKTRDGYHEFEIKWVGRPVDDFSRYDIAVMAEGGSDYTVLSSSDLEQYVNKDGGVLPYYAEETARTAGDGSICYHARVKSAEVTLAGGITTHQILKSNVKYFIKVRAVKIDPTDTSLIAYSKYIGPVNTRTEFNQGDYDTTDRSEKQKAVFLDKMEELEKDYYWRIAIGGNTSRILLKGDRVVDALKNASGNSLTVDMTQISVNISKDEIYVPISVIRTMNSLDRSLILKTSGSELLLRPTTLDASGNEQLKLILSRGEVKDLYLRLGIIRSTSASTAFPSGLQRASNINELDLQAMGFSATESDLKKLIHDKLYDEDTGLVSEKLNALQNTYVGSGTGSSALIDQYTKSLIEVIEKELSVYIDTTLDSVKLSNTVQDITGFDSPAAESLSFSSSKGVKLPYVLYDGSTSWQKLSATSTQPTSIRFNLAKTGKYAVLTAQSNIGDVSSNYWASGSVDSLTSKYDLSDVFTGIGSNFMPENKATCGEVVLLFEKVTGKSADDVGLTMKEKNAKLGLDDIISPNSLTRNISRQQTAAVLIKLFAVKKGVSETSLQPSGRVELTDENSIGEPYYNSVLMVVDMKIMNPDGGDRFYPTGQMTRAEVVTAFVRMLQKTGDL